jgi:hypothetical protein
VIAILCIASFSAARVRSAASEKEKLEQGRYLVEQVGLCGDCHTAHNEKGEPIVAQAFQGASVSLKPVSPIPNWAESRHLLSASRALPTNKPSRF